MSMVTKHISITDQQDNWIKIQINHGNYNSESEVMQDLIFKQQEQDQNIQSIRSALIKGEESGMSQRSVEEIRESVLKRKS